MKIPLKSSFALASTALLLSVNANAVSIPLDSFAVDYGSVSEVSDLSGGGLRLQNDITELDADGARIGLDSLVVPVNSNLLFDWRVFDLSDMRDYSYYEIISLDDSIFLPPGDSTFHHGYSVTGPTGIEGTVVRYLMAGTYSLYIGTYVENPDPSKYILDISNVRLQALESLQIQTLSEDSTKEEHRVPDSSLGFLGIASILGLIGSHRRFAAKTSKQSALA
jgi:hypothetical protein